MTILEAQLLTFWGADALNFLAHGSSSNPAPSSRFPAPSGVEYLRMANNVSGTPLSIDLDSESLTFTGGTGIDTSGSGNEVTFAIDSTVTTNSGTQTLTNKTISGANNTISNIDNASLSNSSISFTASKSAIFISFLIFLLMPDSLLASLIICSTNPKSV